MPATDAQIEANRLNAEKSTGPKSPEGKKRSSMNGSRHNLTGQAFLMTEEDRFVYDKFCKAYLGALKPENPIETQLAHLLAQDNYRLNRIHAIEENTFALGHFDQAANLDIDHPEVHHAITQTEVFAKKGKVFNNLSLYEQRLTRNIHKNMKLLADLQDRRKAEERFEALADTAARPKTRAAGASSAPEIGFAFSTDNTTRPLTPETASAPLDSPLKEAA